MLSLHEHLYGVRKFEELFPGFLDRARTAVYFRWKCLRPLITSSFSSAVCTVAGRLHYFASCKNTRTFTASAIPGCPKTKASIYKPYSLLQGNAADLDVSGSR